jgi:pimeloyl-ACP methyl ester carboxylesterase
VTGGPRHRGPVISERAGTGRPLVLLHGLAGSARWWSRNIPDLAEAFDVHAVDLPAFGGSSRRSRFRLDRIPGQLVARMDRWGIERASVIGHSMGGLIAARLAADHPDRVDRLILVDAAFLSLDPSWWRRGPGPLGVLRWTQPSLIRTLGEDLIRVGPIRLVQATRQLLGADWADDLERIAAQTLVVWGEHDTLCPPTIGRAIVERVPRSRLVTIPRAGHNPMWEAPAEFDRIALEFLGRPPAERSSAAAAG